MPSLYDTASQQPPVLQSENQRVEIAKAVGRFVEQVQKDNPQANIISVGDYNDLLSFCTCSTKRPTALAISTRWFSLCNTGGC